MNDTHSAFSTINDAISFVRDRRGLTRVARCA
jgi:hypothetical protein